MKLSARLNKLEHKNDPGNDCRWLMDTYKLGDPTPAQPASAGKYRLLIYALRKRTVDEHFYPLLLARVDETLAPEEAGELERWTKDETKTARLSWALSKTIKYHVGRGAPLELPFAVLKAYAHYPAHRDDPEYPPRGEEAGRVLADEVPHDCELCGYVYPALDNTRCKPGINSRTFGTTPLFSVCLLCGGAVGRAAYWLKNKAYPNGLTRETYTWQDRIPGVTYPPECR